MTEHNTEHFSSLEFQFLQRERELADNAARRLGVTSLLPADWENGKAARLKKCAPRTPEAFFFFARTYFPPHFFEFDFSIEHRRMIQHALSADKMCRIKAAHRKFGKTMMFRVFKAWCACFGHKHFYGKVSDTIDLVEKDFRYVRMELKMNPKLVMDFGELIDPGWDTNRAFFVKPHGHNQKGTLFVAFSATVTARGELAQTRLDFLEFDDFEDYATSINPEISRQKLEIIERDFMPALADNGCAILLGNNARTTSLINILVQMSDEDRAALHPAIEVQIIPAWDKKNYRATWHQRFKFKTEEAFRLAERASKSVWSGEYMQEPTPPEGIRFLLKHWNAYDKLPRDARGVIMCDPAYGTTSAYKTMAVLLYSMTTRKFYAPDVFCRRCGWEEYFQAMYTFVNRWRDRVPALTWEANFGQAQYLEFQKLFVSVKNLPPLPIRFKTVEGEKHFRISKIESPFSLGNILFASDFMATQDGIEAQSQLIGYNGKTGNGLDFPDALSSAYDELWPMMTMSADSSPMSVISGERRTAERH